MPVSSVMAARAIRMFPLLARLNVVRMWSGIRVMTQDGFPIYDQSETCPGAFVVCCHSGVTLAANHALTLAPMIARGRLDADGRRCLQRAEVRCSPGCLRPAPRPFPSRSRASASTRGRATRVAAALLAAGFEHCRTTPVSGAPRAPYCMMGVCFECLVTIDGVGNRQGCLVPVREGMRVELQRGKRDPGT